MRKVEMLTGMAGRGYTYKAGQTVELPDEVAKRFVEHKVAKFLDGGSSRKAAPKAKRGRKATRKPQEER